MVCLALFENRFLDTLNKYQRTPLVRSLALKFGHPAAVFFHDVGVGVLEGQIDLIGDHELYDFLGVVSD